MPATSYLPRRAGAGFKPEHFAAIMEDRAAPGFFEIHAENYMGAGGPRHAQLTALRERHTLSIHGVGLSIGSPHPLDRVHLQRLRELCDRYQPESFSEHLAWSSHGGVFYNDLLPVAYTEETLRCVVENIDQAQRALGREMLLENPSTYVRFSDSTISEAAFLTEVAARSGCGLLLDVSNIIVSTTNHATSAQAYLDAFPLARVRELHLAGHAAQADDAGCPLLIDAHGSPVPDAAWRLHAEVIARTGPLPTLIEWDNDVPDWPTLRREVRTAQAMLDRVGGAMSSVAA